MTILERIYRRSPERDPAPDPDDAELIERSRYEPERFADVFDRHADRVYRYLARRVGPTEADDLLSGTFLNAFEQRGRFDPVRSPAGALPWLLGIATNQLRSHRRAEARRWELLARSRPAPPDEPSHADRVAAKVDADVVAGSLVEVMAALPPGDRDALLLLAWADLKYEEIAEALQIPIGTVRSRIHRVRGQLRKAIDATTTTLGTE